MGDGDSCDPSACRIGVVNLLIMVCVSFGALMYFGVAFAQTEWSDAYRPDDELYKFVQLPWRGYACLSFVQILCLCVYATARLHCTTSCATLRFAATSTCASVEK